MDKVTDKDLLKLYNYLDEIRLYSHTVHVLNFDMSTVAPEKGMDDLVKGINYFSKKIYEIQKDEDFINLINKLKKKKAFSSFDQYDQKLINHFYRIIEKQKNITTELNSEFNETTSLAYVTWLKAKSKNSYKLFAPTLEKVYEISSKVIKLEDPNEKELYNTLFDDYEPGFKVEDLDNFFSDLEENLIPLVNKIRKATYVPRHDFIHRRVPLYKQEQFSRFLLEKNKFDFSRGSLSTTEHPFTDAFSYNDVRVTTHYFEDNFISNMYSIIHEGGHALFEQNLPKQSYEHRLDNLTLTMAKHESVSRFYENIVGRSKEYLSSIYPTFLEIFKDEFSDISLNDLYEGVNYVDFSNPIRTEADELTYSLHILIRYKLERKILKGEANFKNLNNEWKKLYKDILNIDVKDDKEGILQDVHWSSGFGYFPTYALGNALNYMYVKKMDEDIHFLDTLQTGRLDLILEWMKKKVFSKATTLDTKEWIKSITGNEFSAKDYIEYLNNKFLRLYHLK